MKSEDLRKIQSPLKQKYREQPESAVVTLRALGTLGEDVSCKIENHKFVSEAGLHPASGGDGTLICSAEMLLEALVGCAGVTLKAVSTSLGINIRKGTIKAEGEVDFRGTLAVSKEAPVGFKSIRLIFTLDTDATPEQKQTLLKLTERYCVVFQTLNKGVTIESSL